MTQLVYVSFVVLKYFSLLRVYERHGQEWLLQL